jgi:hypothetical protein
MATDETAPTPAPDQPRKSGTSLAWAMIIAMAVWYIFATGVVLEIYWGAR